MMSVMMNAMGHASMKTTDGYRTRVRENMMMNRMLSVIMVGRCPEAVGNGPL